MPANAWQVHAEIDRTVCKVDENLRAFAQHWEHAKVVAGTKETEKHATELRKVISFLRQHKAQIRKWTAQNSVPASSKDKLKDATAKIDRDLRRFQEFEQALKSQASQSLGQENIAPAQASVKPAKPGQQEGVAAQGAPEGAPSEVKVQWNQLLRDGDEDREMIEEFVCKICQVHVVGCDPKLSRCSHLYCGDCIAQWFAVQPRNQTWAQRAQAAGAVPCPVCKEPLKEDTDLFPVCAAGRSESAFLYRMLSGLKIMCANNPKCRKDGKCDWTGEYGSFQEHMRGCKNIALERPSAAKEVAAPSPNPAEEKPAEERPHNDVADALERSSSTASTSDEVTQPEALAIDSSSEASGSECADQPSAVVVEAPDAEAALTGGDSEPVATAAAPPQPASLTDLIQALVDLKVQERTSQQDVPRAEPAEPARPGPKPAEAEPAAKACTVVIPFSANGPGQLALAAGDLVEVVERNQSGWTFGRKASCSTEGWFPEWAINTV